MRKGEDFIGVSVVFYCHDGKGNVLFAKRSHQARDEQGVWDIGAGGLEFGERVEDTLHKEIKEEYNADVLDAEFLGYRDVHRFHEGEPTHWIALDFKVRIDPANVKNNEPHKFDEVGWFKKDNFPQPPHSQFAEFLKQYKDRLN